MAEREAQLPVSVSSRATTVELSAEDLAEVDDAASKIPLKGDRLPERALAMPVAKRPRSSNRRNSPQFERQSMSKMDEQALPVAATT
jgi:hypothetical protein